MISSSSLSKAAAAAAVAACALLAASAWAALAHQDIVAPALGAVAAIAAGGALCFIVRANASLRVLLETCRRAGDGDMEARIVKLGERGLIGDLATAVNRQLDVADAFVREAIAAMEHAREGKFYRKLIARGLPGAFRYGATSINTATETMAPQLAEAQQLARDFESKLKGVIEAVASASTQVHQTAQSLTATAEPPESAMVRRA